MPYQDLKSYQNALIIHDFTMDFVKRYIDFKSRTKDQMEQAARSGKQNIVEATANSKQKPKSERMLLGVASASLKELLEDYKDYLRQHDFEIWGQEDARALAVRKLVYRSDKSDRSDGSDRSYWAYESFLEEVGGACNAMICLINQTTYLLDNQIRSVESQMQEKGIAGETQEQRLRRIVAERESQVREFDEDAKKVADEAAKKMFGV